MGSGSGLAEELAQDAFLAALEQWPTPGVPDRPGAWLMAAAKLLAQNRARWDPLRIRRGLQSLARAEALGGSPGPYAPQGAIGACHARAWTAAETDWTRIAPGPSSNGPPP